MEFLPARIAARPEDDPIFALNREARRRRDAGEEVVNATVGVLLEDDGRLAVLPSVVEVLREVPPASGAAYAPLEGMGEFTAAVVQDLLGGTPLADRAVAVATPGAVGALRHSVSAFLEHRQAALTTSFYWGPYEAICEEQERALRTFPMFAPGGGLDVAAFEREVEGTLRAQRRLFVLLNDPCHNPTGYSMSDADWAATTGILASAAARVPTTIVSDLAYLAYARDPSRRFLGHLAPLTERALVVFAWSASKAFAQYGLRVGALVACTDDARQREPIRRALLYASRATSSGVNAAGQWAIARCLTDAAVRGRVDTERERLRGLLRSRVDAWNAAATAAALPFPPYDGGFFVTVFSRDAEAAAARLRARGVFVVPVPGALRVALSSVPAAAIPRLVTEAAAVADGARP